MNVFLDSNERRNSKTYYYIRLISEHLIGLVVHNEKYKNELRKQYRQLDRGWEVIPIYSIQNDMDVWTIKDRIKRGTLEGLIIDNELISSRERDLAGLLWDDKNNYKWLTDGEIREIILTDMALGKYMYE